MKFINRVPTVEEVLTHQLFFPLIRLDKKFVYGGRWLCIHRDGNPDIIILTIRKNEISIWNGLSFTQPLKECYWMNNVKWLPLKPNGLPLDYKE